MSEARTVTAVTGDPRSEFWSGIRASLPVTIGVVPFGVTCGVMGVTVALTPMETILMSALVFAGASQFVALTMLSGPAGWGMIVLTTLLINLRHLLMGASLAPYMKRLPMPLQALLAFGIVDESYVLTMDRLRQHAYDPSFHLGCHVPFYVVWLTSTAIGAYMGRHIADPLAWGLDFAMPATFLALLVPRLVDKTAALVCVLAGAVSVAGALYLPGKWYIIVACLVASLAGGLMEGKTDAS
ncbi:MAG: AzlC family ABC transporter permease [Bacillota bacterium]